MHGPTAAAMRSTRAPSEIIAAIAWSVTPASAPRQPAWAAPITPASASASRTGAQSAVTMPSSRPGRSVTSASACGRSVVGHGSRDDHRGRRMDLVDAGQRRAGQDRVGGEAAVGLDSCRIVAAAQPAIEAGDRPVETPPPRPKKPCGTPSSAAARTMSRLTASAS